MALPQDVKGLAKAAKLSGVIQWPKPLAIKCYGGSTLGASVQSNQSHFIPNLAAADGSGWFWQIGAAGITYVNAAGTVIYNVSPATDVNAAAVHVLGLYVDYVAGRLYMVTDGGGNNFYLASTTLATKSMVVRAVGTAAFTATVNLRTGQLRRAAQGSGNFTFYVGSPNIIEKSTITESSGAMTAPAQLLIAGVAAVPLAVAAAANGQMPAFFVFADEKIITYFTAKSVNVARGGGVGELPSGKTSWGSSDWVSRFTTPSSLPLHEYIAIVENGAACTLFGVSAASTSYARVNLPRHYALTDMLDFINKCADAAGCPT